MRQSTSLTTTTTLTNAYHYFRQSFQQLQFSPVHILESSPSVPGEVGEGDSLLSTLHPPVVVGAQPVVPSPLDVQGGDVVALEGGLFKQVVSHLCKTTADVCKVDSVAFKRGLFKQVVSHLFKTTDDVCKVDSVAFKGGLFKQVVSHLCKTTADVCKVDVLGGSSNTWSVISVKQRLTYVR